jgi:hypothetical protein
VATTGPELDVRKTKSNSPAGALALGGAKNFPPKRRQAADGNT